MGNRDNRVGILTLGISSKTPFRHGFMQMATDWYWKMLFFVLNPMVQVDRTNDDAIPHTSVIVDYFEYELTEITAVLQVVPGA